MAATRYKDRSMQQAYSACVAGFGNRGSELWLNGTEHRRGALHRCAFWDGFEGKSNRPHAPKGTLAWACYMAGRDCAKVK